MSLLCSFSPFVMGKFFLRKGKCYLRNVSVGSHRRQQLNYSVQLASCVGTMGGVGQMRGPGACPRYLYALPERTSTRPPPIRSAAHCPYANPNNCSSILRL